MHVLFSYLVCNLCRIYSTYKYDRTYTTLKLPHLRHRDQQSWNTLFLVLYWIPNYGMVPVRACFDQILVFSITLLFVDPHNRDTRCRAVSVCRFGQSTPWRGDGHTISPIDGPGDRRWPMECRQILAHQYNVSYHVKRISEIALFKSEIRRQNALRWPKFILQYVFSIDHTHINCIIL
jgi:hypothetical protein